MDINSLLIFKVCGFDDGETYDLQTFGTSVCQRLFGAKFSKDSVPRRAVGQLFEAGLEPLVNLGVFVEVKERGYSYSAQIAGYSGILRDCRMEELNDYLRAQLTCYMANCLPAGSKTRNVFALLGQDFLSRDELVELYGVRYDDSISPSGMESAILRLGKGVLVEQNGAKYRRHTNYGERLAKELSNE